MFFNTQLNVAPPGRRCQVITITVQEIYISNSVPKKTIAADTAKNHCSQNKRVPSMNTMPQTEKCPSRSLILPSFPSSPHWLR